MKRKWKSFVCLLLAATMLFTTGFITNGKESVKADEGRTTKTLVVDISNSGWTEAKAPNVHYWGGSKESKWPGDPMTAVDGKNGFYQYEVPADSTGVIFNSDATGSLNQTVNITDIREGVTYEIWPGADAKTAKAVMKDENGNTVDPVAPKIDSMKIRFDNSNTNWQSVSIHYWGKGVTGTEWPGAAMTKMADRDNVYEAEVPVGITGIVFTDAADADHVRSSDVTDIPTREEWEAHNTISAEYVSTGYEYEKYVVLRKDDNGNTYHPPVSPSTEEKMAKQVNTHIGTDYSYVNLSFTTVGETDGKVTLTDASGETKQYTAEGKYSPSAEKYKYTATLDGLKPATTYTYTIGEGDYAVSGTFRSIPAAGGNETLKFAYLCDTQVGTPSDAEAANATFHYVNQNKDLGFVYIGGDLTDNSDSKVQWENLFETENGQFKDGGKECLSNNLLAVCQGNHDKNNKGTSLSGYVTAPSDGGNLVYSFDYGKVKFIVLNLETANGDDDERDRQKTYLEKEVKAAKEAGQWTVVGFHKSIYTGASHIIDKDVVNARKFWSPVFAELGVDMVLQAHDHVLARGFINGDGTRGNLEKDASGAYIQKANAPLYYVGGHAGGLKWYSAKDYTVGEGDPLLPNYEFLDVDSATCANPTDESHETMYTIVEATNDQITTTTYAFKYDQTTHQVTEEPHVYDTLTLKRTVSSEEQKPETKDDAKPAVTPDTKDDTKPAVTPDAKDDAKPAVTPDAKDDAKPAVTPDAKDDTKPAATTVTKDDNKSSATNTKTAGKPDTGDHAKTAGYIMLLLGAGLLIAQAGKKRAKVR